MKKIVFKYSSVPFKEVKSKVFILAHYLQNKYFLSLSDALQKAWKAIKLKYMMEQKATNFSFYTKENILIETKGILKNIPKELLKNSSKFEHDLGTFRYWDLQSSDFKSFKINNLISINF